MTAPESDGFLHRWSRRKVQARAGRLQDDAVPPEPAVDVEAPAGAEPLPASAADAPEPPLPTLDDVRALTPDSDFAPFVARRVAPDVKNAALKKLFADPHYNVMDGLDTYIDDYSNMEPLPAPMLRRLASARALAMFDPADEPAGGVPAGPPPGADAAGPASGQAPTPADPQAPAAALPDSDAGADAETDLPPRAESGPASPAVPAPRVAGGRHD